MNMLLTMMSMGETMMIENEDEELDEFCCFSRLLRTVFGVVSCFRVQTTRGLRRAWPLDLDGIVSELVVASNCTRSISLDTILESEFA